MVKHEIKVELEKSEDLLNLIQKAYFQEGLNGKILGKDHYITIEESDDINWTIFNGLNNATVKISNSNVIDGTMRFIVDETSGEIRLYPISIYCIKEDEKYIFY
jgi:hypothetical protein